MQPLTYKEGNVKVTLMKYGGLAAMIQQPPLMVESSDLPKPAAADLTRLVAAVKAAPAPKDTGPGQARDEMSYTITIEEESAEPAVEITQSDTSMTPSFTALLKWLERYPAK